MFIGQAAAAASAFHGKLLHFGWKETRTTDTGTNYLYRLNYSQRKQDQRKWRNETPSANENKRHDETEFQKTKNVRNMRQRERCILFAWDLRNQLRHSFPLIYPFFGYARRIDSKLQLDLDLSRESMSLPIDKCIQHIWFVAWNQKSFHHISNANTSNNPLSTSAFRSRFIAKFVYWMCAIHVKFGGLLFLKFAFNAHHANSTSRRIHPPLIWFRKKCGDFFPSKCGVHFNAILMNW